MKTVLCDESSQNGLKADVMFTCSIKARRGSCFICVREIQVGQNILVKIQNFRN